MDAIPERDPAHPTTMKYLNHSVHTFPGGSVVQHSRNSKLSHDFVTCPVHTTHLAFATCPSDCVFARVCYAKGGPLGIKSLHAEKSLPAGPLDPIDIAEEEARGIARLPGYGLLRIHEAGDTLLPEAAEVISKAVREWKERCRPGDAKSGRNIWYTRSTETTRANYQGVSIIRSCQTTDEVAAAHRAGMPAAMVVTPHSTQAIQTINGVRGLLCPQQQRPDVMDCYRCGFCTNSDRMVDLGLNVFFVPHGASKARVAAIALAEIERQVA